MKHLKIFTAALLAAAIAAVASSSASAAVLTSPAGTEYTGEIHMTLAAGTSSLMRAGLETTCTESTVRSKIEVNNEEHAASKLSVLSFPQPSCTKTLNVLKNGSLTVAPGGTFWIFGNEWTLFDLGVSCVYGGGVGTKIGTLAGGTPAVLNVSTTELKKISGSFLCASTGTWTASYTVTTPETLLVD